MKTHHHLAIFFMCVTLFATAQEEGYGTPYIIQNPTPCLSESDRELIKEIIAERTSNKSARSVNQVKLEWPIRQAKNYDEYGAIGISNYVDLNDQYPNQLLDYNCGTRTYDTDNGYNHKGTDIYSWPFNWHKMDHDHMEIVAAAAGEIIYKENNQSDKSCSFNSNRWNAVYIQHDDGSIAWYGHLKTGSATKKAEGERVEIGEYLGVMGSSGNSTGPHLHFELYDSQGNLIDPFVGDCNSTTNESWWKEQQEYTVSGLNRVATHHSPPEFGCHGSESPNLEVDFSNGVTVYFATYFRDQMESAVSTHAVYKPDGTIFQEWTTTSPRFYSGSYWYRSFTLPASGDQGQWRFTSSYAGDRLSTYFYVTNDNTDQVSLSTDYIQFADYTEGDIITSSFDITNTGENGVIVTNINYPENFKGNWDGIIHPQETKTIHFTFEPALNLPLESFIEIETTFSTYSIAVSSEPRVLGSNSILEELFYPNPVKSGVVTLNGIYENIQILSLSGQIIKRVPKSQSVIEVSHLKNGIYLLQLEKDDVKYTRRLIIAD
ncbi:Por secretion system C-terminal sorting domain-containing protein [Ekhidna lutea]|uniref:Por secretion system C-terminal sorting domain-containing protein n=1 Tax=Ekhidna lutea TaxID=447679 RepID=A0A239JG78_EKHLU|nr:peptidoglycan DD-metalloendopeptidase family protein [Ekhidna lutea]SNT04835.1 Por secretion system C-terminal sorting domain-containing protein [Ekhidna lutea]